MEMFKFDEELTLDSMAHAASVDLEYGQVTLYVVMCVGGGQEPHFSHGGQLTVSAIQAVEAAKAENEEAFRESAGCRYLPAAVGINPDALMFLARLVATGGLEEPGDVG